MKSILITGSNRGLGLGLVKYLAENGFSPKYILAACRNPAKAEDLQKIAGMNKNVHVLEFVTMISQQVLKDLFTDLNTFVNSLKKMLCCLSKIILMVPCTIKSIHQANVKKFETYNDFTKSIGDIVGNEGLNVLVNNAGVSTKFTRLNFVKVDQMMENFTVNTLAPLMLSKACLPLLQKAVAVNSNVPVGVKKAAIINMSSILGSIQQNEQGGFYPYRASKAALNSITRSLSIDLKKEGITVFSLHPGWVKTDMGGPNAPLSIEESIRSIVNVVFTFTEEKSGHFVQYDGKELPW